MSFPNNVAGAALENTEEKKNSKLNREIGWDIGLAEVKSGFGTFPRSLLK